MSAGDAGRTPKKFRQLSITESFGSIARKRKLSSIAPEYKPKSKNNSIRRKNGDSTSSKTENKQDTTCEKANISLNESAVDKTMQAGSGAESTADISVEAMVGGKESCRNFNLNKEEFSKKNVGTSRCYTKQSANAATNIEEIQSNWCTQSSDDLYDIIMAEKRDANIRLLKKEIKEDSDVSQSTPPTTTTVEPEKPVIDEICESPDMFETYPTPDFDFEEEIAPVNWMGMPKSRLKVAPECVLPLPQLQSSKNHTILYDTSYLDFGPPPPSKSNYVDAWDSDHVKLSCSPKSLFPAPNAQNRSLINRWELIENALLSDIKDSNQLEKVIKSYNVRFSHPFTALHRVLNEALKKSERDEFFSTTLPEMVKLALSLSTVITQPIPLLKRQCGHCLTLSQHQIACLLANAFLCTFPRRNSTSPSSEYCSFPSINFNRLFTGSSSKERSKTHVEKLKTILHYFKRVTNEMPSGVVTFERFVCRDFPVWNRSPCELCGLHVRKDGLIEDEGKGMLRMDFANKYVGGGVLGSGLVQEEILFCIFPELIISRLFTEVLDDNECLHIRGAERFSKYSGYSDNFTWEGDFVDSGTRDSWRRKVSYFVAMDATSFSRYEDQYKIGNVRRELNKLYCGFQGDLDPDYSAAIATGNWGCGAFGGDPILKALLQMMAAAVVRRDLCYFTFQDGELMETIHNMHKFITSAGMGVGDLWNIICQFNEMEVLPSVRQKRPVVENIFEFIQRIGKKYEASTDEEDSLDIES